MRLRIGDFTFAMHFIVSFFMFEAYVIFLDVTQGLYM
jgi:hypothetical protein